MLPESRSPLKLLLFLFACFVAGSPSNAPAGDVADSPAFELYTGDRVVFLGNSFFERALEHGHLETSFAVRWPERKIVFRNLGWDGDTVYGHSRTGGRRRAVFGDVEEGFQRMVASVRSLRPSVIIVAYGYNESFDGTAGLASFRQGLRRLLKETDSGMTRFVFLSPIPVEEGFTTGTIGSSGPRPTHETKRNRILRQYCSVIRDVARDGGHPFVNLFELVMNESDSVTTNGIHPSENGYRRLATIIGDQLRLPPPQIDPASPAAETIAHAIVKKNTLYFHRWRPRNDAFVYGERKAEQQIAQTEPEAFEPLIARQENIVRLLLVRQAESRP